MAYIDAVKKKGRPTYVVFRGTTDDGSTTTDVAWANRAVATSAGPLEGRLLRVGTIVRGMPETAGGRIEAVSTSIDLDNSDGALDDLLAGTSTSSELDEYGEDSVLNLTGKLFHGVVDDDGTAYEKALTPTLFVSGTVVYDGRTASLPLSTKQDGLLGRSPLALIVDDVKGSKTQNPDTLVDCPDGEWFDDQGNTGAYGQAQFDADTSYWNESLEAAARFIYGAWAIPAIPVYRRSVEETRADDREPTGNVIQAATWFLFASLKEPVVGSFRLWRLATSYSVQRQLEPYARTIYKIQRWVQNVDGQWTQVWFCFSKASFKYRPGTDLEYEDQSLFWIPSNPGQLGTVAASPPPAKKDHGGPAAIIRALIYDHAGASAIDSTSFERVYQAIPYANLCGGMYTGSTPLQEVLTHVFQAFGIDAWLATDDTVRLQVTAAFAYADREAVAAGGLPWLTTSDIYGDTWREEIPRGSERRGAPVTRVTVEWTDEQREFYGASLLDTVPGNVTIPLGQRVESVVSGAWVNPDPKRAALAFSIGVSARAYATRRIGFVTHLWVGSYELGSLMYVSHPRGLEVSAAGGYERRLVRLERIEIDVGRETARVVFEDLGPASRLKPGLLDDYDEWLAKDHGGATLALAASTTVTCAGFFNAGHVGMTLVARGATNPANKNLPNRKIVAVPDADHATVNYAFGAAENIVGSGSGIDATWHLLYNHEVPPSAARAEKYIQVCKESNGLFTNGDPGFTYGNG